MNWIDLTIIVILAINIGLGWYKGLIRSVVSILSIVLGFICAKVYYMDMYTFLNSRYDLLSKIKSTVADTFSSIQFPETIEMKGLSAEQLSSTVGDTEYMKVLTEKFFESDVFKKLLESNVGSFSDGFSSWLADNLLTILSMVTVFMVVFLGVRIIGYFLSQVFNLPILKGVNKLSGLLFGTIKGIFFAMLFVTVLVVFGPLFSNFEIVNTLELSAIGLYFYKYNVIMFIFESML